MKRFKFFLVAHPLQGLGETLLVGLALLNAAAHLEGYAERFVFQTAVFFLCGLCGMWAVLRIRLPQLNWKRQTLWELGVGLGLSLVMLFPLRWLGDLFRWDAVWRLTNWEDWQNVIVLGCTGIGYVFTRIFLRLVLKWNRMRRERMLWSLTHAHLTVVVFFALLGSLLVFLVTPYATTAVQIWSQTKDPLLSLFTGVLITLFPAVTLITVMTVGTLAVMLPPLALFSFFVARRTTRRLETLAATTAALRAGDYDARVAVEGEDEVARLQSDFNSMAEKLSASLTELKEERDTVARVLQSNRDLVANVSHDLRTPVATLRAAVESVLGQWDNLNPDEARQKLAVMEGEIQQLSGLIDDLFTLSQADVDHLSLNCAPLGLQPVIEQAVNAFAPLAWQAGRVEVAASLPDALPPVLADSRRVQQALVNLLRNGAHHTPPGGIIVVQAVEEENTVRVDVRDTGEGIAPEDLPHVWERFFRGQNATAESAGLGLALVKEMVEKMGGNVSVESEAGKGSCFSLRLPKA